MSYQFLKSKLARRCFSTKVCENQRTNKSNDTLVNSCKRDQPEKDPDAPTTFRGTTPQYDYTNSECRLWIAAQLRTYNVFLSRSTSISMADNFVGSGRTMFEMEREDWVKTLGKHGYILRFLIRRILWNKKRSIRAGLSQTTMNDLRGECTPEEMSEEEDLGWDGLYSIR